MDYLIMGIASCIIIALIVWYVRYSQKNKCPSPKNAGRPVQNVKCPVCQSNLFVGENLISKVFRPMNVPDQLMIVLGCPHCYPSCEPGVERRCPVCGKSVGLDQSLTARLFNKQKGKKHVHVIGCSNCHAPRCK